MKPIYTVENTREIFMLVERLNGVTQMEKWHPEGDAFQHTLQVVNWALKESDDIDLLLAALLHDVGKFSPLRGHASIGANDIAPYVSEKTKWLVYNHMRVMEYLEGKMRRRFKIDNLVNHPWFLDAVQLYRWDKLGRNPNMVLDYEPLVIISKLNRAIEKEKK